MSVELIETALVGKLSTISLLKKVHEVEPKRLDTLPAATLYFEGFDQKRETFGKHRINWRWILRVYLQLSDEKKAQKDMKELVQSILSKWREDTSLGGSCINSLMTTSEIVVIEAPGGGAFLNAQMTFEAEEII
jgi:hypothetical protein